MKSNSNIIQTKQAPLKNSRQTQDHLSGRKSAFENTTKSKQKNVPGEVNNLMPNADLIDLRVKADEDRPE